MHEINRIFKNLPSDVKNDMRAIKDASSSVTFKIMTLNINLEEIYRDAFCQKKLRSKKIYFYRIHYPIRCENKHCLPSNDLQVSKSWKIISN